MTAGRNGEHEVAACHLDRRQETAGFGIVGDQQQHAPLFSITGNRGIDLPLVRAGHHQKSPIQVRTAVWLPEPFHQPIFGECLQGGCSFRGNQTDGSSGGTETTHFSFGNFARANHDAAAAFQMKVNWVQIHMYP